MYTHRDIHLSTCTHTNLDLHVVTAIYAINTLDLHVDLVLASIVLDLDLVYYVLDLVYYVLDLVY